MLFFLPLLQHPVNHYLPLYVSAHVSFLWKHLLNSLRVACNVLHVSFALGKPPLYLYIDYFPVSLFYYSLSFLRTKSPVYSYIQHNVWYSACLLQ